MVTFAAHLSVTIKRLTRYEQKVHVVLVAMLRARVCLPTWQPIQIILLLVRSLKVRIVTELTKAPNFAQR